MSTLKALSEIWLFDDSESSNDPEQVRIKYSLDQEEELSQDFRADMQLSASSVTTIPLPDATYSWLYILTDQQISVRLSGSLTDEVVVKPTAAGERDGIMLIRSSFDSLDINVEGSTSAKVFILAGIVEEN